MHHMYQISAVIDDDVRSDFKYTSYMSVVFFFIAVIPCMNFDACLNKRCCHIILRG